MPTIGSRCHCDRAYTFLGMGDFARMPREILYVATPNEDRKCPANQLMWTLATRGPCTVHLNFRSEHHASCAASWLETYTWAETPLASPISSGYPNGPYQGPVYSKVYAEGGTVTPNPQPHCSALLTPTPTAL